MPRRRKLVPSPALSVWHFHRREAKGFGIGMVPVLALSMVVPWSTAQARPPEPHPEVPTDSPAFPVYSPAGSTVVVPGNCTGLIESTGFEKGTSSLPGPGYDGDWEAGYQICGPEFDDEDCNPPQTPACVPPSPTLNCCGDYPNIQNCWFATAGGSPNCNEPHIDTINPSTLKLDRQGGPSIQHMRFQAETVNSPIILAYSPLQSISLVGPTIIKFDLYGSETGAHELRFRAIDDSSTVGHGLAAYMLFVTGSQGGPDILINPGSHLGERILAGLWTPGVYKEVEILSDPCRIPTITPLGNSLIYKYDGATIFTYPIRGGVDGPQMPSVERVNWMFFPRGTTAVWDIDNYSIVRGPACPHVCGDGFVDAPETCEPSILTGTGSCNPGHSCNPPGTSDECTCSRLCTLDDPCILVNGDNGPYYGPCDATYGCIFLYEADTESVSINSCGSTYDSRIFYWGSESDPTDPGSNNNDCCNPARLACGAALGAGSDQSAPCYVEGSNEPFYPACTCHDNPAPGDDLFLAQLNTPSGSSILRLEVNKKTSCGSPIPGGACCVGETGLCTDGANETKQGCILRSPQASFHPNKACGLIECVRHTGACCDNNVGVVHCNEGTYPEDCGGPNRSWVKGGLCSAVPGVCPPLTLGACCDTLAGVCTDGLTLATCGDTNPLPNTDHSVFTLDATCADTPCDADLGACCDQDSFGGCEVGTNAECQGDKLEWTKGGSCATSECVHIPIPTVSTWGLVVLTLVLLSGGKVCFGRRALA